MRRNSHPVTNSQAGNPYATGWLTREQRMVALLVVYLLCVSPGLAQSTSRPATALDQLTTWRPVREARSPNRHQDPAPKANEYRTLAELTRRTNQGKALESLLIDVSILDQGGLPQLSAFRAVRSLYVRGLGASQADSLVAIVQAWPRLERLSIDITQHRPTPAHPLVTD